MNFAPLSWWELLLQHGHGPLLFLFLPLFVIVPSLMAAACLYSLADIWCHGAEADAVVTAQREIAGADPQYRVTIAFIDAHGLARGPEIAVGRRQFNALVPRTLCRARYSRRNRWNNAILTGARAISSRGILLGVAAVATVMPPGAILIGWTLVADVNRAVAARTGGRLLAARTIGLKVRSGENGDSFQIVWKDETGTAGQSWWSRDRAHFAGVDELGAPLHVYVLGKGAFWEGDLGRRIEK